MIKFAIHRSFFPKCSGRIHRCLFRHQLTLTKVAFTVSTILLSGARILWFSRSSIVQNRSKAWGTFLLYCWITVIIFCLIVCKAGYTSSAGATADGTCQACALGYYKSSTGPNTCTHCGSGKTTADVASAAEAQCGKPLVDPGAHPAHAPS